MKWQQRLEQNPDLRDPSNWPPVLLETIPFSKRKTFLRNQRVINLVLRGSTFETIAAQEKISISWISKLMTRCLGGSNQEDPLLFKALIPYAHVKTPRRRCPIPASNNSCGNRCAFLYLLDQVPNLRTGLDKCLLAFIRDNQRKQNLTPRWFFSEFKRLLAEARWPLSKYPYTEPTLAYSSVYRYFIQRQKVLRQQRRQKPKHQRITNTIVSRNRIFEELQFDWQTYDQFSGAAITDGDTVIPIALSRVSLLALVDVTSEAVLGFTIAFTKHPSQDDLLACLQCIHKSWAPIIPTTPGLKYIPGAGFPSGLIPGANCIIPGRIRFDNAWSNDAETVRNYVTASLHSSYNSGLKAKPLDRRMIEHIFRLTIYNSHRPSSTTGSHVRDPKRQSKKNAKKVPIISLKALEECAEVVLASYNATPKSSLLGQTPLDIFSTQLRDHYTPRLPYRSTQSLNAFEDFEHVTIRQNKQENRWPHVNFCNIKYTGKCLDDEFVDKKAIAYFDRRDIRTLKIYTLHGEFLGTLYCSKKWRRYPHSLKLRSIIISWIKQQKKWMDDPLANYFSFLLYRRRTPKNNLELVKIYRQFTSTGLSTIIADSTEASSNQLKKEDSHQEIKVIDRQLQSDNKFSEWTPDLSGITHERNKDE